MILEQAVHKHVKSTRKTYCIDIFGLSQDQLKPNIPATSDTLNSTDTFKQYKQAAFRQASEVGGRIHSRQVTSHSLSCPFVIVQPVKYLRLFFLVQSALCSPRIRDGYCSINASYTKSKQPALSVLLHCTLKCSGILFCFNSNINALHFFIACVGGGARLNFLLSLCYVLFRLIYFGS